MIRCKEEKQGVLKALAAYSAMGLIDYAEGNTGLVMSRSLRIFAVQLSRIAF